MLGSMHIWMREGEGDLLCVLLAAEDLEDGRRETEMRRMRTR
jgi:hypothetical protein